ncbi:BTAD domain-containing putative transcriptional regulator [Nonomuraea basaltis]|uniref:BTAD domain-containing putative transcriptional regulator n=1 Tax=Nonomuraea basaltis TaxID=2495887 RepID=UPI00110C4712|nr:BTAD domain-containing putative transcriptional regulator [Nonomuraea basaltis]TMS00650.1 ATPase [Nonomuraea basaltis]
MVRIRILGQFQVEVAGRRVEPGSPLQRAVLARLICAGGHVVSTDQFIDDLWHGQPPPKALGALQAYVSNLRRVLEPGRAPRTPAQVLASAPPGYRLRLAAEAVDAWRLPHLVEGAAALLTAADPAKALGMADEALGMWSGPAYAEFAEDAWAVPEAAKLEELRLIAVEYRAEARLSLGRHLEVGPELERHVALHPLRENAVRLLALAHYRAGRQGDALAVLRRTRQLLAEELGVDPGPALTALQAGILSHAAALDLTTVIPGPVTTGPSRQAPEPAGPVPAATGPVAAPPSPRMIGRTAELGRLLAAAGQTRNGFRVAWLGGDPGVGKSTLAEALLRRLCDEGWQVAVGRCPETLGGAPPAWAWSEVLRSLSAVHRPAPEIAARLAPLLSDDAEQIGQFWLARAAGDYLQGMPRPLLVVLEDVHRADDETLQLLRHLAPRLAQSAVLVLLTHRPAEAGADLLGTRAALAGQSAEDIDLAGLDAEEVRELLVERSGVQVDAAIIRTVTERTEGNPLFVAETARLLAVEGPSAAHTLPPGVRDLIRRRIARLPATTQTTLRNAAVLGRDAEADVLIAMPDADEESVLDGLEAGVLAGLLTEPRPGHVRFTHILVRETLYEGIPRLRRIRLHAKILTAMERVRPGDVTALGHHALAAATTATARSAAEYARKAAEHASALYAHREAATLLHGALDALDLATDAAHELRVDLMCRLVAAQAHAGDVASALANRSAALAIAKMTGAPDAIARAAISFHAPVIWSIKGSHEIETDLVEAIQSLLATATGEMRCRLLIALVQEMESAGPELLADTSAEAVEIARGIGDPHLLCMALNARYWVVVPPGRRDELEALGHELLEISARAGLLGYQTLGHHALCVVALGRNDWATARRHADQATEHSTTGQLGLSLAIIAFLDALHLSITGKFAEAEAAYTLLTDRIAEVTGPAVHIFGALARFSVRLACGRAHESVTELAAARDRIPHRFDEFYVRALVAAGRLDEARAAWPAHRMPEREAFQMISLALRAANAIALDVREVAEECYRTLLPYREEMAGLYTVSVTLGPVSLTLGELAEFLGEPATAAQHYATAAEVAAEIGSTHWRQRALEALAEVRSRS